MDKKYQIFISSTYIDLIQEREKVRDVILSMYQFPIGMEMFSAADEEQWEIIKETIDSSDYYVLIIGKRYGTVIDEGPDKGISYTEKEYRYAKSIGLPIMAYIKNDDAILAKDADDDSEKITKLKAFKDDVTKGREVKWFANPDDLGTQVTLSLHKEMDRKKRPGWIRGDAVNIEKSLSEIVELSKQNRELQEENKRLSVELEKLKSSSERKPLLTVSLKCTRPDENEKYPEFYQREDLITIDEDETVHLKLKKTSTKALETEFLPLSRQDVPFDISQRVSDQAIKEYNDSLPTKDELEKYLNYYRLYTRIKENGIPITFFVNNIGNAKATDVTVTIELPKQVGVFEVDEAINMSEPQAPQKGENPIEKARWQAEQENAISMKTQVKVSDGLWRIPDITSLIASPFKNGNTINSSIEIADNIVAIEEKQGIVHSKFAYFYGAYIVPLCTGEFEAKVTLMCAEYEDPEERTIKFIVED